MESDFLLRALHSLWTVGAFVLFVAIVAWTLWPSHKKRLEQYGRIPFEDKD